MTIIGILVFIGGWIYAVSEFGFFLGVGVGWFPALIVAGVIDTILIIVFGMTVVVMKGVRSRDY